VFVAVKLIVLYAFVAANAPAWRWSIVPLAAFQDVQDG
jgi:hypothetical protein